MTPALRAHVRLLESWPRERIRTHERPEPPPGQGAFPRGRTKADTERLRFAIKALKAKGTPNILIARELRVSTQTVRNHLRGKR